MTARCVDLKCICECCMLLTCCIFCEWYQLRWINHVKQKWINWKGYHTEFMSCITIYYDIIITYTFTVTIQYIEIHRIHTNKNARGGNLRTAISGRQSRDGNLGTAISAGNIGDGMVTFLLQRWWLRREATSGGRGSRPGTRWKRSGTALRLSNTAAVIVVVVKSARSFVQTLQKMFIVPR